VSESDLPYIGADQAEPAAESRELFIRRYTEQEVTSIYELARLSFETGDYKRAEIICSGLIAVAPDFIPGFLLMAIVQAFNSNFDKSIEFAQQVLKLDSNNIEAQVLAASVYLTLANFNMAGTLLGEISEKLKRGIEFSPVLKRFYEVQLARFEAR
jgi:tetratricopeptide (TPR) repeat protein